MAGALALTPPPAPAAAPGAGGGPAAAICLAPSCLVAACASPAPFASLPLLPVLLNALHPFCVRPSEFVRHA
jgi:hypothetical protein